MPTPKLTSGSFCTGIGTAELGWGPLGIEPIWFSEIEPFANEVLATHYPNVKNVGDMTKVNSDELKRPDIVCAGTPCQSFSIAGLRGGLDDARGNLAIRFVEHVGKIRPKRLVWELSLIHI